MKPKLIIFDMDGTMLDTEPLAHRAIYEAAKAMGYELETAIIDQLIGRNQATTRAILAETFGENFDLDRAFKLYLGYKDAHIKAHGIATKRGLFEILDKLESLGIKKCVATSTDKEHAIYKLQLVEIFDRFEVIIGGDEVENGKPAPDIFLKAAAACGVDPCDCVVIEDTPAGIHAAHAAKIPVIVVPDIAPLNEKTRALAVRVCADLFEVSEMF